MVPFHMLGIVSYYIYIYILSLFAIIAADICTMRRIQSGQTTDRQYRYSRDKNKLQKYNEYTSDIHYGSKPDKFLASSVL